jgi:hypothetical protein
MKPVPKGIYLVAVAFFLAGLVCIGELLPPLFYLFGFERERALLLQAGFEWVLVGGVLAFLLLCYAVFGLVRLHPVPQWALFAMTLLLMFRFLSEPTGNSPFYSPQRIYLNRFLLLLPLMAACVYLLRPRIRAASRELRAPTHRDEK